MLDGGHRTGVLRIGTAGWTITPAGRERVPASGSHLERYAAVLPCVEINSSFHRSHRVSTWAKWAASTPEGFRFSAKLPKTITHVAKLVVESAAFDAFVEETAALREKLGAVLVQLPPSLTFEDCPAAEFFEMLRERLPGTCVAFEPRHRSWFGRDAEELLLRHEIARVAADPIRDARVGMGELPRPGGWGGFRYFRLHGSPRMYYSAYGAEYLERLAGVVAEEASGRDTWVVFDNTASGETLGNALDLQEMCNVGNESDAAPKRTAQPKPRRAKVKGT